MVDNLVAEGAYHTQVFGREALWESGATIALFPGQFDANERYNGKHVNVSLAAGKRHRAYLPHDVLYTGGVPPSNLYLEYNGLFPVLSL